MAIKRDAADKWFSDVVRLKAMFTCQHCGKSDGRMECAHIFGRAAKSVRWSMDNALCLCHYCHRTFTANPLDFTAWLESKLGQGHLDLLREKWNILMPTNKLLRAEIAKHYREEHKKMTADETHEPVSYN
jgi:hypothetical protein|tara:strand:+ start:146 stop:535 length:390 start_codon:yes stop_codon:yes gene_type:complete